MRIWYNYTVEYYLAVKENEMNDRYIDKIINNSSARSRKDLERKMLHVFIHL